VSIPRPAGTEAQRLRPLAATARGRLVGFDVAVTGITASSGLVRPGDLFAALPGRRGHGARFAEQARTAGAVAVLTDPAGLAQLSGELPAIVVDDVRACLGRVAAVVYGRPSSAMTVLGVTGTSGKTTTTFLVRAGLIAAGRAAGLIGTVATMIGEESVATGLTTPEAPDVQALLAVMRDQGTDVVAMEVSSHALTMGRADGIDFAVGAFTNLSQDHLDFHADMEDYFAAKARLFDGRARVPIVVVDDAWGRRLADAVGAAVTVSTTGSNAAWWAAARHSRFTRRTASSPPAAPCPAPITSPTLYWRSPSSTRPVCGRRLRSPRWNRLPYLDVWSGSTLGNPSSRSSTTATSRRRSRARCGPYGHSRKAGSSSCSAAAATATVPNDRSWDKSPRAARTC
jgi:UDP-N-acetylmuramyl tripeptide synthase